MRKWLLIVVGLPLGVLPSGASAGLRWGRTTVDGSSVILAPTFGQVTKLDGSVRETTRPFYDLTDPAKNEQFAESYSLQELGFKDGYQTFGLSFEAAWRYFTLQMDATYLEASVHSVANRDYYIGVSDVSFQGQNYDYMVIPEGQDYRVDFSAGMLNLRGVVTPVSLELGRHVAITPGLYLGLATFVGQFTVEAGPARGVVEYEIPPREYVVGGRGEGWSVMALPEVGAGGEVRLRMGDESRRGPELAFQGFYAISDFAADTDDLGASSRHNKTIDLEYEHYEARLLLALPLSRSFDLLLGAAYGYMRADADVLAQEATPEEIEARREKFNKKVHLELSTLTALVGLQF